MTGHELADLLDAEGFDFFTGVPCSLAEGVIAASEPDSFTVAECVRIARAAGPDIHAHSPCCRRS